METLAAALAALVSKVASMEFALLFFTAWPVLSAWSRGRKARRTRSRRSARRPSWLVR